MDLKTRFGFCSWDIFKNNYKYFNGEEVLEKNWLDICVKEMRREFNKVPSTRLEELKNKNWICLKEYHVYYFSFRINIYEK